MIQKTLQLIFISKYVIFHLVKYNLVQDIAEVIVLNPLEVLNDFVFAPINNFIGS